MFDVIILGLGGMGSAAALELAGAGLKVLGLEQFGAVHDKGSSFGKTRMTRKAYMEGDFYIPLLERAYEKWFELNERQRRPLINLCGGLYIGPEKDTVVQDALASARAYKIPVEVLSAKEIRDRFPVFNPAADALGVFEPSAGYVNPDATLFLYQEEAQAAGAELHFNEGAKDIQITANGVEVETANARYQAKKLVVTAGAWLPKIMVFLGHSAPLEVWRMVLHWFEPEGLAGDYLPKKFPPNLWRLEDGHLLYGFPWTEEEEALKYAFHDRFDVVDDLAKLNREVSRAEIKFIRQALKKVLPSVPYRHQVSKVCLYTMTPDHHFILGALPDHGHVILAGGFSGHGFKFVPVVGEILRDLVLEKQPDFDLNPFRPERFSP